MTDSPTQPENPPEPTDDRPQDISASRRGFFREMLILGLDGLEKRGRQIGQRLADAVETSDRVKDAQPKPPILKLDRDQRSAARGQTSEDRRQRPDKV